jgi:hypothetical protein
MADEAPGKSARGLAQSKSPANAVHSKKVSGTLLHLRLRLWWTGETPLRHSRTLFCS